MDREARWATVHGVAELDTTLHLSSHAPPHHAPPPPLQVNRRAAVGATEGLWQGLLLSVSQRLHYLLGPSN